MLTDYTNFHGCRHLKSVFIGEICQIKIDGYIRAKGLVFKKNKSLISVTIDLDTLSNGYPIHLSDNTKTNMQFQKDKIDLPTIKTDFDNSIEKISIVLQDIGRVILNLLNNAFYAVKSPNSLKGERYDPTIIVSTKRTDAEVLISVKDNGVGIPDSIKGKIFQPFFTTKPTGQGTGLGLSLAYDMIRAHGEEIKVDSKEGEGSNFIIQLPAEFDREYAT